MNNQEPFRRNDWPTLGVELELQLVDAQTLALRSAIGEVLGSLPGNLHHSVKPEFMQCYVEINTNICRTVAEVATDLAPTVRAVELAAARHGLRLFWAATHPFSHWRDQQITPDKRYYALAELLRETVVRPVTFGLHVHVGVPTGDMAIRTIARLRRHLPLLLALSANSPFWHGRSTGHHAHRIEVLEGFPTGGLPPQIHSWEEYTELVDQLQAARFIESQRELWWDVRPNAQHGTVEIRICDMPPDLPSVLAVTALIQCLVHQFSLERQDDIVESECVSVLVRQNRWRACRYGLEADLVEPDTLEAVPARLALERLVCRLRALAADLGCDRHLESVLDVAAQPNGAERQITMYERTGDLTEVVRQLVAERSHAHAGSFHDSLRAFPPPSASFRGAQFCSAAASPAALSAT